MIVIDDLFAGLFAVNLVLGNVSPVLDLSCAALLVFVVLGVKAFLSFVSFWNQLSLVALHNFVGNPELEGQARDILTRVFCSNVLEASIR